MQAYCGRCKEERAHQVVALNSDNRVEQVICNYCRSAHRYRDPEAKTATRQPRATSHTPRASPAATKNTLAFDRPARAYSPRETFTAGDGVMHQTFGRGVVVEVRQGKIDVRFGKELRTLLHAG